jgi:hypothetical protein
VEIWKKQKRLKSRAAADARNWFAMVKAEGEEPIFKAGDALRIASAFSHRSFPRPELHSRQRGVVESGHRTGRRSITRKKATVGTPDKKDIITGLRHPAHGSLGRLYRFNERQLANRVFETWLERIETEKE